ncbi:hypothetical protein GCM10027051_05760 [Niabella terrae]
MSEEQQKFNPVKLMILVFVLLSSFFFLAKALLANAGVDYRVVAGGNLVLFLVGLFTLRSGLKAIEHSNPHVFVRVFYGGFILRLFVCAVAAFLYIYFTDGPVSKPSLFACLGIYVLYAFIEVRSLKKALNLNKNA